jgi:hypothetical protein
MTAPPGTIELWRLSEPTAGGPAGDRLCWQVTTAALRCPRIDARLAAPATGG